MHVLVVYPMAEDLFPWGFTGVEVAYYPLGVEGFAMRRPMHHAGASFFGGEVARSFVYPTPAGGRAFFFRLEFGSGGP